MEIHIGDKIKCFNGTTGYVTDVYDSVYFEISFGTKIHIIDVRLINGTEVGDSSIKLNKQPYTNLKLTFFRKTGKFSTTKIIKLSPSLKGNKLINFIKYYPEHIGCDILVHTTVPHLIKSKYRIFK